MWKWRIYEKGTVIVPVLEHWLLIEDKQIHETAKSALLRLSKNIDHE